MSTELPMSAPPRPLPMAPGDDPVRAGVPALDPAEHEALVAEVRDLAVRRDAVILAHNYQLPEVQDVADVVGDSLGLSIEAAKTDASTIVFCGVHFMAESASVLSPEKTVLIPDVDAGCSLADSISAEQLAAWQAEHPGAITVMYVNTTAAVKALTDYCVTSSNAVPVVEQVYREHGEDAEILFGPDMFLGSFVAKRVKEARGVDRLPGFHVWDGECHVHAGIKPGDIERVRGEHPDADFLIHPECGCSTSVMEYVASGDVDTEGVHMLSTGGMLDYATARGGEGTTPGGGPQRRDDAAFTDTGPATGGDGSPPAEAGVADAPIARPVTIVATETGMLHPLREAAPGVDFVPANVHASCGYMKMITLRKLRDTLRDGSGVVKVPDDVAERARRPIERMVAIGRDANAPLGGE